MALFKVYLREGDGEYQNGAAYPSDLNADEYFDDIFESPTIQITGGVEVHYKDGLCPDCGEMIPTNCAEGVTCANCGHTFCAPQTAE